MSLAEVRTDDIGSLLSAPQVRPNHLHQIFQIGRPLSSQCIALDVLVQKLIRIQLRTVRRKPEHFDRVSVLTQPALDSPRPVNGMAINDQEHFLTSLSKNGF